MGSEMCIRDSVKGPFRVGWLRNDPAGVDTIGSSLSAVDVNGATGYNYKSTGFNPNGYSALGLSQTLTPSMTHRITLRWDHGGERLFISTPLGMTSYRCDPNFSYASHRQSLIPAKVSNTDPLNYANNQTALGSEPQTTKFRRNGRIYFGAAHGPGPIARVR